MLVGEWSLATDNCAMWLNGFHDNAPGYPKVSCGRMTCAQPYVTGIAGPPMGAALGVALLAAGLLPSSASGEAVGYPFCLNGCGAAGQCNDGSSGRPADGRCVCTDGRGGKECSLVRPGVSLRMEASTADYGSASTARFDRQNGMVYLGARSTSSNRDGVIEFDPETMQLSSTPASEVGDAPVRGVNVVV